jgi:phospholipid/cholesterol/gamma-HCH transport system ATP-binding protein
MVRVRGLGKEYGGRPVLSGIDLDVAEGEVLAIMGASGGGKTTLLRCISGLVEPSEGSVEVFGSDVVEDPEGARRKMGMVFQSAALFDFMTVFENVEFGLKRLTRLKPVEREEQAAQILRVVGLEGSEGLLPGELSGGMRKRVGLARALVLQPKLMLYDEPTTGLDPITTYTIDALIVDVRKRLGMTSIVVSHDVASVFRVADRVAFLEAGRLTFVGTPDEFGASSRPAIREVLDKASAREMLENR